MVTENKSSMQRFWPSCCLFTEKQCALLIKERENPSVPNFILCFQIMLLSLLVHRELPTALWVCALASTLK